MALGELMHAANRQATFADLDYAQKKRQTRREIFLAEMEAVMPWERQMASGERA